MDLCGAVSETDSPSLPFRAMSAREKILVGSHVVVEVKDELQK
jgi:hypothetical protein